MPTDASASPGHAALADLDRVLSQRPHADGDALSSATRDLCRLRDDTIARSTDTAASRDRLAHLNAVISVVLAGHFPLGSVPWDELHKARIWLADAVDAIEPR